MISIARATNRNVTRWRDGQMVLRWTAAGMLNAQRSFRRVLVSRVPVAEVADRCGVSRKSVHAWVRRYQKSRLAGLVDRSRWPHFSGDRWRPRSAGGARRIRSGGRAGWCTS
jgi:hypothetical protein